jgi:hypothetical protein
MVQIGKQKYRRMFLKNLLSYLACGQNWLNLPVDHHHFGYNTKLGKKKKKTERKKKTLLHTSLFYTLCTTDRVKNLRKSKRKTA